MIEIYLIGEVRYKQHHRPFARNIAIRRGGRVSPTSTCIPVTTYMHGDGHVVYAPLDESSKYIKLVAKVML